MLERGEADRRLGFRQLAELHMDRDYRLAAVIFEGEIPPFPAPPPMP